MDPFQNLVNFSKRLYRQEDLDQNTRESLEKLCLEQTVEKNPVGASAVLFQIADFQELSAYTKRFFDPADLKAIQIRLDVSLIRRDLMARKKYLIGKFREAAWRCCKRRHKDREHVEPFARYVSKQAQITVLPTSTVSSVYLTKIFKYAVKKTILEHKREMGGDPWDEFFYRVYSVNKNNLRISLAREELDRKPVDEAPQGPSARMARLSDTLIKGGPRRSPSPHMSTLVGKSEKEETVKKRKLQKIDVSPSGHPRFRFGKVPHSPDGRTSLTRLFYLPLIDRKGVFSCGDTF